MVKAHIAPTVLYVGTVLPPPNDMDKSLSRMTYKFIGKGSEKEARALLCKRKDRGGLDVPNWKVRCASAITLWAEKATQSEKPWTKLLVEPGINWKNETALYTIRS